MHISVGDRVRDIDPTWPNYGCTGVVTSVNRNMITWVHDTNKELITDNVSDLEKITSRRNKMPRHGSRINIHNIPGRREFNTKLPEGSQPTNNNSKRGGRIRQKSTGVGNTTIPFKSRKHRKKRRDRGESGLKSSFNNNSVRSEGNGGNKLSKYVYATTGKPYSGKVVTMGGLVYSTTGDTVEGDSVLVVNRNGFK